MFYINAMDYMFGKDGYTKPEDPKAEEKKL